MYSELENFSKELKWYSAEVYNKEFLVDVSMVTRMEIHASRTKFACTPTRFNARFWPRSILGSRDVIIF